MTCLLPRQFWKPETPFFAAHFHAHRTRNRTGMTNLRVDNREDGQRLMFLTACGGAGAQT